MDDRMVRRQNEMLATAQRRSAEVVPPVSRACADVTTGRVLEARVFYAEDIASSPPGRQAVECRLCGTKSRRP